MIFNDNYVLRCSAANPREELLFLKFCALHKLVPEFGKLSLYYNLYFDNSDDYVKFKTSLVCYINSEEHSLE